jgi:hypothetical protein
MGTSKFALYAAETSKRTFVGDLLKYNKGVWTGDKTPISPDELFVAVMNSLTVGFVKWAGGKVVDDELGLVVDGYRPPHRNELGDLDSKTWEKENDGALKDPWQKATMLVFVRVGPPNEIFTFSTATTGGQSAIADLCEAHGRTTEGVGQYPVVELASDSYQHKVKSYGTVYVPVFRIVDSVDAAPFDALVAEERGGAAFMPANGSASIQIGSSAFGGPPLPPPVTEAPEGPAAPEGLDEISEETPF